MSVTFGGIPPANLPEAYAAAHAKAIVVDRSDLGMLKFTGKTRLDLINRKLALEVERHFGAAGLDPEHKAALVDFRMDDGEEFIL